MEAQSVQLQLEFPKESLPSLKAKLEGMLIILEGNFSHLKPIFSYFKINLKKNIKEEHYITLVEFPKLLNVESVINLIYSEELNFLKKMKNLSESNKEFGVFIEFDNSISYNFKYWNNNIEFNENFEYDMLIGLNMVNIPLILSEELLSTVTNERYFPFYYGQIVEKKSGYQKIKLLFPQLITELKLENIFFIDNYTIGTTDDELDFTKIKDSFVGEDKLITKSKLENSISYENIGKVIIVNNEADGLIEVFNIIKTRKIDKIALVVKPVNIFPWVTGIDMWNYELTFGEHSEKLSIKIYTYDDIERGRETEGEELVIFDHLDSESYRNFDKLNNFSKSNNRLATISKITNNNFQFFNILSIIKPEEFNPARGLENSYLRIDDFKEHSDRYLLRAQEISICKLKIHELDLEEKYENKMDEIKNEVRKNTNFENFLKLVKFNDSGDSLLISPKIVKTLDLILKNTDRKIYIISDSIEAINRVKKISNLENFSIKFFLWEEIESIQTYPEKIIIINYPKNIKLLFNLLSNQAIEEINILHNRNSIDNRFLLLSLLNLNATWEREANSEFDKYEIKYLIS